MFVNRFQMWQGSTATIFLVSNSTPIARKARAAPLLIYVFFPLSLPPRSLVLDEISLGWKSSPYLWPCGMSVVDANFFPPHALPFFPFGILHTTQRRRCFPFLVSFFSTISSCLCFFWFPLVHWFWFVVGSLALHPILNVLYLIVPRCQLDIK